VLTRRSWLGLYRMNSRTAAQRTAFLQRVDRKMRTL
jgi:hypothetical protein